MSTGNPLTDAAASRGAPTLPQGQPRTSTPNRSSVVGLPTLTPTDSSASRISDLERQIQQLTEERDGNRALVSECAEVLSQRNALIITSVALLILWWTTR